jgi:hypothetical protein
VAEIGRQLQRKLVADFLKRFKELATQKGGSGMLIWDRDSYVSTQYFLGITDAQAREAVLALQPDDYYRGVENLVSDDGEETCEFGIDSFPPHQIYVKLHIRRGARNRAICMSFHIAKHSIDYPLKSP